MDVKMLSVFLIVFIVPTAIVIAWRGDNRRTSTDTIKNVHIHAKRHMMQNENDVKRRTTTQRSREIRKKPSGHLKPLEEDDIENDEVVSVAIGPPAIRPKYEKPVWKQSPRPVINNTNGSSATRLVKEVLIQLGREFLTHQINEDFVFGQYIGNAMRNLRGDLRLRMQHEVLELVVKYQKLNRGEAMKGDDHSPDERIGVGLIKDIKAEKKASCVNDTEEPWPDFSNFAKIVG